MRNNCAHILQEIRSQMHTECAKQSIALSIYVERPNVFAIRALEDNHIARSLYIWGKAISLAKIRYYLLSLFPVIRNVLK